MKILNKIGWLGIFIVCSSFLHPFFVSVTEVEHNSKDKTIEVSCKLFTDDFEKALRQAYKVKIDLLDKKQNAAMKPYVADYIKKHLALQINGKPQVFDFVGFEQIQEGIFCYFEIKNVSTVKQLTVTNNSLYELQPKQSGVVHATANGQTKSTKAENPKADFNFSW